MWVGRNYYCHLEILLTQFLCYYPTEVTLSGMVSSVKVLAAVVPINVRICDDEGTDN